MKLRRWSIGLLVAFTSCTGPQIDPVQELDQAKAGIAKANAAFMDAVKAGNSSQLFQAYYAEDAMVMPPNQGHVSGRDNIERLLDGLFRGGVKEVSLETDRVERSGKMAVEVGRYTMHVRLPNGETLTDPGKYVVIFGLQPDGSWKARIDIFNSSASTPPPAASAGTAKK